jgi:hypothetical protein
MLQTPRVLKVSCIKEIIDRFDVPFEIKIERWLVKGSNRTEQFLPYSSSIYIQANSDSSVGLGDSSLSLCLSRLICLMSFLRAL